MQRQRSFTASCILNVINKEGAPFRGTFGPFDLIPSGALCVLARIRRSRRIQHAPKLQLIRVSGRILAPSESLESLSRSAARICGLFSGSCSYWTGMDAVTMKSWPLDVRAEIFPPCALTMALAIDSPMPWPPVCELRELSMR